LTAEDVSDDLQHMASNTLVQLYEVAGVEYLAHPNWAKYQVINKRTPSKYPAPPEDYGRTTVGLPPNRREVKLREENSLSTPEAVDGDNGQGRQFSPYILRIIDAWQTAKIYPHNDKTLKARLLVKHAKIIADQGEELVLAAIAAYCTVRDNQAEYWFDYRYTLWRFLEKIEAWLPEAKPLEQFHNRNKGRQDNPAYENIFDQE